MNWLRQQSLTLGLLAAVGLAFWLPEGGMRGGWLRSESTTIWGVVLIFFLQGLSLPTRVLAAGLLNWRLHCFVQSWIFLFAPILMGLLLLGVGPLLAPEVWPGFWYLAILPTTVSSAVALTALAHGNTAGALFNVTLANVLAVILVPLWSLVLISGQVDLGSVELGGLLADLARMILLPLVVGQLVRPWIATRPVFAVISPWFKTVNNAVILFIVYAAFCNSVQDEGWATYGFDLLIKVFVLSTVFVGAMGALTWWTAKWLPGERDIRIAAFYCASQKSLATGVPMANAIFAGAAAAGHIDLGLLILPLLISHPLQLLLGGYLAGRLGERKKDEG